MTSPRRRIGWALLALAGLAVAVAITVAGTQLTSQRIGLDNSPLGASDLAPPTVPRHGQRARTTTGAVTRTDTGTVAPRPRPSSPSATPPSSRPSASSPRPPVTPAPTPPSGDDRGNDQRDDDGGADD